jgi:hypothetical protein
MNEDEIRARIAEWRPARRHRLAGSLATTKAVIRASNPVIYLPSGEKFTVENIVWNDPGWKASSRVMTNSNRFEIQVNLDPDDEQVRELIYGTPPPLSIGPYEQQMQRLGHADPCPYDGTPDWRCVCGQQLLPGLSTSRRHLGGRSSAYHYHCVCCGLPLAPNFHDPCAVCATHQDAPGNIVDHEHQQIIR